MYFWGKEKRDSGNWWKKCGMRDSHEKGAGMRDQDPPLPDPLIGGITILLTWDVRCDKHTTWFVQLSWKGLELMTYNYNSDSAFQTLWMEIQFSKKATAFNFLKSCINYITLLRTSNITLMKPLRIKSLPICQIMLWITLTKTFPKLTPVHTCWYVKDFLFSSQFLVFQWAHAYI